MFASSFKIYEFVLTLSLIDGKLVSTCMSEQLVSIIASVVRSFRKKNQLAYFLLIHFESMFSKMNSFERFSEFFVVVASVIFLIIFQKSQEKKDLRI